MLIILADDLTGALDSAAPFAGRGLHTEIALDVPGIDAALAEKPDVLTINLACREKTAQEARDLTLAAMARLPAGVRLFKKIDSRLKGNIAAEFEAMAFRRALVAPAIPEFGRIVVSGQLMGFGVDQPIAIIDRLGVRARDCVIPDTETASDMRAALEDADQMGVDLLVGARGLAEALAERMTGKKDAMLANIPTGKALFVIGSRDPITLAQIDALKLACALDDIPAPNGKADVATTRDQMITLVQAVPGNSTVTGHEVSNNLAASVVPTLTDQASTLLLCGGATAEAVLARMGISRCRLMGEVLPGLGLAFAGGQSIVTKSGGFGQPDTLARIAAAILSKVG